MRYSFVKRWLYDIFWCWFVLTKTLIGFKLLMWFIAPLFCEEQWPASDSHALLIYPNNCVYQCGRIHFLLFTPFLLFFSELAAKSSIIPCRSRAPHGPFMISSRPQWRAGGVQHNSGGVRAFDPRVRLSGLGGCWGGCVRFGEPRHLSSTERENINRY